MRPRELSDQAQWHSAHCKLSFQPDQELGGEQETWAKQIQFCIAAS